ncbi:IS30 family transposase [Burkholderia cepacia]|uniref:IS30 family transposase n=1 Tax=Burkholderia cepacia TaxID=292 RepID=UPI0029900411|nr:IS30 family transposase [Burkholderia cepacia]MDW9246330.1 homeo-like domain protein [Burkholderia cepacia]MDW9246484.1 homeo-like domain protein [Burkholderia cepacia]
MKQRRRIYYTDSQKAVMWERWRKGESLQQIAQLFDRNHSSVQRILAETGGIQPKQRRRSSLALTLAEREEISRSVVAGDSIRAIANRLGRAPSTISRELKRNGGMQGYRANNADELAWERARRPQICKLVRNRELAQVVASKLQLQWSPEQIAGWLKHVYAVNRDYQVSHETIYRSLYIQARGALKKELLEHLRRSRAMRRSRHHTMKTDDHGRICDTVPISERPATVDDRAIPGHWEGDLLFGSANSQIATLVERQSRFVMLVKVASKDTEAVINALIRHAGKLPHELYKSLTWDRGKEMADHTRFTVATDIKVYFCDPQSPWQRGSNENTNGLLRQYFLKGIDLSAYSQAKLNAVARRLNERPRKTLDFDTPAERFHQFVASTG